MTAAEQPAGALGNAVDDWADWLGDMDESANHFDITDEATTIIEITVEELARRIAARLAAVPAAVDERAGGERERVRHLHRETFMSGVAWDCAEGECEHPQCHDGGEMPEVEFRVCAHELDLADQSGLLDEWIPGWVMYPCQTIRALDFPALTPATPPTQERPGD